MYAPHALPMYREEQNSKKRKERSDRKDPIRSKKPDPPVSLAPRRHPILRTIKCVAPRYYCAYKCTNWLVDGSFGWTAANPPSPLPALLSVYTISAAVSDARARRTGAPELVQQLPPVRAQGAPCFAEKPAQRGENGSIL